MPCICPSLPCANWACSSGLTALNINGNRVCVTKAGVACLLAQVPGLRTLSTPRIEFPDADAEPLQLQHLVVSGLDTADVVRAAPHLHTLTDLSLSHCPGMTSEGFVALAQACSQLQALELHGLRIEGAALAAFAEHCTALTSLGLPKCQNLNNPDLTDVRTTSPMGIHSMLMAELHTVKVCGRGRVDHGEWIP